MSAERKSSSCVTRVESRQRHDRIVLALASVIILLSFLLDVRSDERIEFTFLAGFALPHTCLSRALFEWNCPLCGMTRSFIFLAEGRWAESVHVHALGWLVALIVLAQIPHRIVALRNPGRLPLGRVFPQVVAYTLLAAIVIHWTITQFV